MDDNMSYEEQYRLRIKNYNNKVNSIRKQYIQHTSELDNELNYILNKIQFIGLNQSVIEIVTRECIQNTTNKKNDVWNKFIDVVECFKICIYTERVLPNGKSVSGCKKCEKFRIWNIEVQGRMYRKNIKKQNY